MFRIANIINRKIFKSNYKNYIKSLNNDYNLSRSIIDTKLVETNNENLPSPIFTVGLPRAGKSTIEAILSSNELLQAFGYKKGILQAKLDYENIKKSFKKLNLSIDSTYREIKSAYLKLAKEHHPDKGGDQEVMSKIIEGYNFLKTEYEGKEKDYKLPNFYKFFIERLGSKISSKYFTSHTSPNNILYTRFIMNQIPNAKIIYCYRNPKDHIIELYKYNIKGYLTLKNSVINTAKVIMKIDNTIKIYKKDFPSKIYFMNFDQLILEPKQVIQSLLSWLNWEYDENYLNPKLTPKGVIKNQKDITCFNSSYLNNGQNYREVFKSIEKILCEHSHYKNLI